MKIVNIDAQGKIMEKVRDLKILPFILDVIKPLEEKYYGLPASCQMKDTFSYDSPIKINLPTSPIRMFYYKVVGYENIATLIHTIPIYLRNDNKQSDEIGIIDALGAYYPNIKRDSPYIELFLTSIYNESKNDDTQFKWLFTKVLLHELAHAAMDIHNIEKCQDIEEKKINEGLRKWREESMANAVALRIINDYENDVRYCCQKGFYDYARKFMEDQESEYALGVKLVDFDYWVFRSIIESKINGVKFPDEWMEYVKNMNPDLIETIERLEREPNK